LPIAPSLDIPSKSNVLLKKRKPFAEKLEDKKFEMQICANWPLMSSYPRETTFNYLGGDHLFDRSLSKGKEGNNGCELAIDKEIAPKWIRIGESTILRIDSRMEVQAN